jgi:hypothetical protein
MIVKSINIIAALSLIVGATAPALAQSPSPSPAALISPRAAVKTVDLACVKTAVEKRDNAVIAALDAFHTGVKQALTTRRDALRAAWDVSDKNQRKTAIRAAWSAFDGTWKKARRGMETAKKTAWNAYRTDAKACRGQGEETRTSEGTF